MLAAINWICTYFQMVALPAHFLLALATATNRNETKNERKGDPAFQRKKRKVREEKEENSKQK